MKSIFLATFLGDDLSEDAIDSAGRPFVDRDPELFDEVLRLLRGYEFKRHPRLIWSEVKAEADYYQVPNLDALSLPPNVALPPDMPAIARKITFSRSNTKRCHWIPTCTPALPFPADVETKLYSIGNPSFGAPLRALCPSSLLGLGFVVQPDSMEYTRKEKTVFYAKVDGIPPDVPFLPNEIMQEEAEMWLKITYWLHEDIVPER